MSNRAGRQGRALAILIVSSLVLGGFFAAIVALSDSARAGPCDQVGGVISGDWTITTTQVCSGIVYTVDGTININSGGKLTLIDGGLRFAKDEAHRGHSLNVNAGGELVLDNSIVTTETNAIAPYLKLAFTVSGAGSRLTMVNGAILKFPGWFNATEAALNISDSTITGFRDSDLSGLGIDTDDNNDAPVIVWSSTVASLYRSRIERLYEYLTGSGVAITLESSSSIYAYDSYIGVDYSNSPGRHNELQVDGSSNAYLFNVTIDREQDPLARIDWQPAFRVTAVGGNIYLLRWLHATVVDSSGIPVSGATIWSRLSPSTTTAQYPDNGLLTTPSSRTLWYLGRAASGANAWNRTDADGRAKIPLYTDRIDANTLPNAESFGNYEEQATYVSGATYTESGAVSFPAYPEISVEANNRALTLSLDSVQVCPTGVTTWGFSTSIVGTVSISSCLEISGDITITDGGIYVDQGSDGRNRAYVKILGTGSLTLVNSDVWSNFPLAFYVADGGDLIARAGSELLLSARGTPGMLRSDGSTSTVTLTDAVVDADVYLYGGSATLKRVAFLGPNLWIDTSQRTRLWDANLVGVTSLGILTDDGDVNTVDVDIRNTTFNSSQTDQLVFGGAQHVELTSVQLYDPSGTWWSTMITGGAKVSRYWWLMMNAVDGTGTLLSDADVRFSVSRTDPQTLTTVPAPNPGAEDLYYAAGPLAWPISAPDGFLLYRAFAESRTVSTRLLDNSYVITGTATLDGTDYNPDEAARVLVTRNENANLVFSSLTPDLTILEIRVSGGNFGSQLQPINTPINVTAVVRNNGQINVRNVLVVFFEDDVDKNRDLYMDFMPSDYEAAGLLINRTIIPLVPKNGNVSVTVIWRPSGALETSRTVSAVVDPPISSPTDGGLIRETDETNNILGRPFVLFTWPDLAISPVDIQFVTDPVVNNDVQIRVTVHNLGTNRATGAILEAWQGATRVAGPATFDLVQGQTTVLTLTWRPSALGNVVLTFTVNTPSGSDFRNKDYNLANNQATFSVAVLTQPDFELRQADYASTVTVTQNQPFTVYALVYNLGQTAAVNVSLAAYLNGNRAAQVGRVDGLTVGAFLNQSISISGISLTGTQTIMLVVDPDNRINEGGAAQERNNFANITLNVQPPQGSVFIVTPSAGQQLEPGARLSVTGYVRDQSQNGIVDVDLTIELRSGTTVVANTTARSQDLGFFVGEIAIPGDAADGSYSLVVMPSSGLISQQSTTITVKRVVPFLNQPMPILGLPWWLFFIILAAVAALLIGVTLYFKVYGLGKMVECGECGAFIPEDATSCPKCGVEFEKDMAKCSNCQAWIPVDVKQCPECGVQFATGQVEMADYQEKMRLQYDEVVHKFREDASRQLGRALSEREFQEWWRKQPTFLTFEDWLREEEEMRKMGSKPCPVCGTLNSVTATVCHKCGSLMREAPRPPSGGAGGGGAAPAAAPRRAAPAPGPAPSETPPGGQASPYAPPSAAPGTEAIPRRVIRRPVSQQPVVQKKVIKRPLGEEGGEQSEQSGTEGQEDEL